MIAWDCFPLIWILHFYNIYSKLHEVSISKCQQCRPGLRDQRAALLSRSALFI